jgi:hypothetical protein
MSLIVGDWQLARHDEARGDDVNHPAMTLSILRDLRVGPLTLILGMLAATSQACPFCDVVGRPLAARRDAASVVAVGESDGEATESEGVIRQPFVVRSIIRGDGVVAEEIVTARVAGAIAGTAMLVGEDGDNATSRFEAIAADETLLGYMAAAPALEAPTADRLRWFARWLEHPDQSIADDAFMEFGLARYRDVVAAADALDARKLIRWVDDPAIDQRRRGFYGLACGIVAARARAAGNVAEANACLAALERAVAAPADDFRSGYDGLLGGLLVAKGDAALAAMATLGLLADDTRAGDARHALAALRFAHEFLADTIPRRDVAGAVACLASNPAVAADAVIDLARYEHWSSVDQVAALWNSIGRDDPLVRRAVAGYLLACPGEAAKDHAASLAARDQAVWDAAVRAVGLPARKVD